MGVLPCSPIAKYTYVFPYEGNRVPGIIYHVFNVTKRTRRRTWISAARTRLLTAIGHMVGRKSRARNLEDLRFRQTRGSFCLPYVGLMLAAKKLCTRTRTTILPVRYVRTASNWCISRAKRHHSLLPLY